MARQLTITLDDEMMARLEEEARRTGAPVVELVANKLRQRTVEPSTTRGPFQVYARDLGARSGVDFDCVSKLLHDEDAAIRK
jgi:hypothetical protein